MTPLPFYRVPGPAGESGLAHGRALPELFETAFHEAYIAAMMATNRVERSDMTLQASRWLEGLPANFQEEIDGMAVGAGVPVTQAAEFLYADIARATRSAAVDASVVASSPIVDDELAAGAPGGPADGPGAGPMCSAVMARPSGGANPWVARNCDWLYATLMRGTAAVVHETPNRIPTLAVGIRGDIDIDTGINAERLWLHLHTLLAVDDPPRDRTIISWLFWAREALELCASLDDLERFIERTGRDRGVIAVAVDGKTGEGAVFECSKSGHERFGFDPNRPLVATNHSQRKVVDAAREAKSRPESTVRRACVLRRMVDEHAPEHGPDDLIELLGEDGVEMRTPRHLRTIYSAVCEPGAERLWFASGGVDGTPAASRGAWERVSVAW